MTYKRKDLAVQVNIKTDRGYTMHAIGQLEDRLKRLEYYTVLNALDQETKTLSVRDATGLIERFKNGIFADPFNDHTIGNASDPEYSIAISSSKSIARPTFNQLFHEFKLNQSTSTGVKAVGRLLMLDYTSEYFGGNDFATTYRNCTESLYRFNGQLQFFPCYDNTSTSTAGAPQNIVIDQAKPFASLVAATGGLAQTIDSVTSVPKLIAQINDGATITSTYQSTTTKTIKDIEVSVSTINQNAGNYVTDVANLYYMRPRRLAVVARGLRPNMQMHFFFDKVSVDRYVAPAIVSAAYSNGSGDIDGTKAQSLVLSKQDQLLVDNGTKGSIITSDSTGTVFAVFYLPPNTFRSGDRTMIITNVDDINATGAILTTAEGTYTSSSLSLTTSQLSFSILQPVFTPKTHQESSNTSWSVQQVIPSTGDGGTGDGGTGGGDAGGGDPVAQTFTIENRNVWEPRTYTGPGVYLTKIGMFFRSKSSTLGATMVVVETNVGNPDSTKIIGKRHLTSAEILTSLDSSVETVFELNEPALIATDSTYAFYVIPDLGNPDYEIWISEIGFNDKLSGNAVTTNPYKGIMFVSNNAKSWTPIQSQDIKFKLYRARFTSLTGTAVFKNETDDFLSVTDLLRANSAVGISVGDVVYTANTANTAQFNSNTASHPFGIVQFIDELNGIIHLDSSNGKFSNSVNQQLRFFSVPVVGDKTYISNTYLVANATLHTVDDPIYHGLVPKFSFLEPSGSIIEVAYYGTSNSTNGFLKDSAPTKLKNEQLYEYADYERVLRSYSNEVATGTYGANGSATYVITMRTNNPYISPVIDLGVKSFNYIQNLINNDATDENTKHGNAKNKYLSKNVVLNQTAEDLLVYVTGYRPLGTDIKAYAKLKNNTDNENFDTKEWTELTFVPAILGTKYSSPQDKEDFRELVFGLPVGNTVANQTQAYQDPNATVADTVVYYDSAQRRYEGFDVFALKLVLVSNNPVKFPTMRDVRAIALQK